MDCVYERRAPLGEASSEPQRAPEVEAAAARDRHQRIAESLELRAVGLELLGEADHLVRSALGAGERAQERDGLPFGAAEAELADDDRDARAPAHDAARASCLNSSSDWARP